MKILEVNDYKNNGLKYLKVFFIDAVTFKYNGKKLFKSGVTAGYYTNELTKVKPYGIITNV